MLNFVLDSKMAKKLHTLKTQKQEESPELICLVCLKDCKNAPTEDCRCYGYMKIKQRVEGAKIEGIQYRLMIPEEKMVHYSTRKARKKYRINKRKNEEYQENLSKYEKLPFFSDGSIFQSHDTERLEEMIQADEVGWHETSSYADKDYDPEDEDANWWSAEGKIHRTLEGMDCLRFGEYDMPSAIDLAFEDRQFDRMIYEDCNPTYNKGRKVVAPVQVSMRNGGEKFLEPIELMSWLRKDCTLEEAKEVQRIYKRLGFVGNRHFEVVKSLNEQIARRPKDTHPCDAIITNWWDLDRKAKRGQFRELSKQELYKKAYEISRKKYQTVECKKIIKQPRAKMIKQWVALGNSGRVPSDKIIALEILEANRPFKFNMQKFEQEYPDNRTTLWAMEKLFCDPADREYADKIFEAIKVNSEYINYHCEEGAYYNIEGAIIFKQSELQRLKNLSVVTEEESEILSGIEDLLMDNSYAPNQSTSQHRGWQSQMEEDSWDEELDSEEYDAEELKEHYKEQYESEEYESDFGFNKFSNEFQKEFRERDRYSSPFTYHLPDSIDYGIETSYGIESIAENNEGTLGYRRHLISVSEAKTIRELNKISKVTGFDIGWRQKKLLTIAIEAKKEALGEMSLQKIKEYADVLARLKRIQRIETLNTLDREITGFDIGWKQRRELDDLIEEKKKQLKR